MPNRFTPIQPGTSDDQKWNAVNNNFAQLDKEAINAFNVVRSGTVTLPEASISDGGAGVWANDDASVTVDHGLGFIPLIVAAVFYEDDEEYQMLPFTNTIVSSGSSLVTFQFTCGADDQTAYFSLNLIGLHFAWTSAEYSIKYYLLQETAS